MSNAADFFNFLSEKILELLVFSKGTVFVILPLAWIFAIFLVLLLTNGFYSKCITGFRKSAKFLKKNSELNCKNINRFEKKCISKFPKRFKLAWKNFVLFRNGKNISDFFNLEVIPSLKFELKEKRAFATFDLTALITFVINVWFFMAISAQSLTKFVCIVTPLVFFVILRWLLVIVYSVRQKRIMKKLSLFRDSVSARLIFENNNKSEYEEIKKEYNAVSDNALKKGREPAKLNTLLTKVDEMLCCNVSQNTLKQVANMLITVRDKDYTTEEEKIKLNAALGKICAKIA